MVEVTEQMSLMKLEDKNSESDDEIELRFSKLDKKIKRMVCIDENRLESLLERLNSSKRYIPVRNRDFLCSFFKYFEPKEDEVLKKLIKLKEEKNSYVPMEIRGICSCKLKKWKSILIIFGMRPLDKYLLNNGEIHPNFTKFIQNLDYIYMCGRRYGDDGDDIIDICGSSTEEKFKSDLQTYEPSNAECTTKINYSQATREDEGSFLFGDPYCPTSTKDVLSFLPFKIQTNIGSEIGGRGTAGGYLTMNCDGVQFDCVITAAHVVFPWLSDIDDHGKKQLLPLLNQQFPYSSYSHDLYMMDYAMMPTVQQFKYCQYNDYNNLLGKQFGKLDLCKYIWKHLDDYLEYNVYKRGITTHETIGKLCTIDKANKTINIEPNNDSEFFSKAGDSGSIVFLLLHDLEDDGDKLYPIALHFSKLTKHLQSNPISQSIPLSQIFEDYLVKNDIEKMVLRFENPKINGTLKIKRSELKEINSTLFKLTKHSQSNPISQSIPLSQIFEDYLVKNDIGEMVLRFENPKINGTLKIKHSE